MFGYITNDDIKEVFQRGLLNMLGMLILIFPFGLSMANWAIPLSEITPGSVAATRPKQNVQYNIQHENKIIQVLE